MTDRVVVAVLAFRRNDQLARLLPLLVAQAATIQPAADVVVVDNDPLGGAAPVAAAWPVTYLHEPRAGISAARNRALAHASGAGALVFIDDDEIPAADWLATLVARWRAWGCAAVTGPAVPDLLGAAVSAWVRASAAFDPPLRSTGDEVAGAATNNLLLDLPAVERMGVRFDEALGLTGGEDTMFTHTLVSRGGRIRWCQEALVHDPIPVGRATRGWILRRDLRAGTSWSAMELALAGSGPRRGRTRLSLLGRGVLKTLLGLARLALGTLTRDQVRAAAGLRTAVSYVGMLCGALGYFPQEYRRATEPVRSGADG